jgi:hypothetical protein
MGKLFAKFDLEFVDNPKIVGLSDAAFRAYVEGIIYARVHLTDGFLDERIVSRKWGLGVADELTSNDSKPSWVSTSKGWKIHDFAMHQTTSAQIEVLREKKRMAANARWDAVRDAQGMQGASGVHIRRNAQGMPETETETETEKYLSALSEESDTKRARETRMPKSWIPTSGHATRANALGLDVDDCAENFRLHAETHDRHTANWNAAFTWWLKKTRPAKGSAVAPTRLSAAERNLANYNLRKSGGSRELG